MQAVLSPASPLVDAPALWRAAVEGTTAWWSAVAERPERALSDPLRWAGHSARRRRPSWATPHDVALATPLLRLRDFRLGEACEAVPTLVFPPQAGHDSCIVDFAPDQSQMLAIREAGLANAWTLDWVGATRATAGATVEDYLAAVDRAVAHIGAERLNLVGDCQGGWLATIWAALHPERTNTLTIAGAPVDFHAGEPLIHAWLRTLAPRGDLAFYRALVALGGGVLRGTTMLSAFVALKPEDELTKQLGLLSQLDDDAALARFHRFEDWYKHTQDIPGAFYLWIVERLFRDNALVRGELEVGGERVDLRAIDAPLFLVAGARDHITPPAQVWALADATSTPQDRVMRRLSAGGHLGLFMAHEALREQWPPVLAGIRALS
jgi:poly(3-hydroxyalkanoate) synthetase